MRSWCCLWSTGRRHSNSTQTFQYCGLKPIPCSVSTDKCVWHTKVVPDVNESSTELGTQTTVTTVWQDSFGLLNEKWAGDQPKSGHKRNEEELDHQSNQWCIWWGDSQLYVGNSEQSKCLHWLAICTCTFCLFQKSTLQSKGISREAGNHRQITLLESQLSHWDWLNWPCSGGHDKTGLIWEASPICHLRLFWAFREWTLIRQNEREIDCRSMSSLHWPHQLVSNRNTDTSASALHHERRWVVSGVERMKRPVGDKCTS